MIRIKICGITTLDDALAAVEAGADMLGFNFYPPSPRYIEPLSCARLIARLRDRGAQVVTVGVFVNATPQAMAAILDDCGLDLAQLHGDEPIEVVQALAPRAFKAIRPGSLDEALAAAKHYGKRDIPPAFLVDASGGPGRFGGTGQRADWELARVLAADYPLLLAGGLCPENIAAAITYVRPWGVDVASGVECRPGRKDPVRLAAFVHHARRALLEAYDAS